MYRENYLSGYTRPYYRGKLFLWLYQYHVWSCVCLLYFSYSLLFNPALSSICIRFCMSFVYYLNCYYSVKYHCADIYDCTHNEYYFLRCDIFVLFLLIQFHTLIWNEHNILIVNTLQSIITCTGFIMLYSNSFNSWNTTYGMCIRLLQLLQLSVGAYGTVLYGSVCSSLIASFYACGNVFYFYKKPKYVTFGYHEIFHIISICTHVTNMIMDSLNQKSIY